MNNNDMNYSTVVYCLSNFYFTLLIQILKYLEHCLEVESGNTTGRQEGLYWNDPPAVGRVVCRIMDKHQQQVFLGAVPQGKRFGMTKQVLFSDIKFSNNMFPGSVWRNLESSYIQYPHQSSPLI